MTKVVRIITRLNVGGPARQAILLTAHMNGGSWNSLLVAGQVETHEAEMIDEAHTLNVFPTSVPTLRNRTGPLGDVRSLVSLYLLLRRERPEIVHLHMSKARALGGIAAWLAGVPVVIETFHGTLFADYYHPLVAGGLVVGERWLSRLMDAVITVSDRVAEEVLRLRVAPANRVRVIPLGLELDRFINRKNPPVLKRELDLPASAKLIGYVGRLVPIKGLPYLIAAAAEVTRAMPDVHFLIIGDGSERARLKRMVHKAGLGRWVRFLGWRSDLEQIYPDLSVVVLPSLNEGTPVSAIEAMAAGRPVVATRVGGVPDVIRDGESGLLVPPRDAPALAAAIIRVLTERDLGLSLGTAARKSVYPRFSIDRLTSDMEQLYRELLTHKRFSLEEKV